MLLYYFSSKDELIAEVITSLSGQLRAVLAAALRPGPQAPSTILRASWNALSRDDVQPVLRAWFDLVGLASRGDEPYRRAAAQTVDSWVSWLAASLDVSDDADPSTVAGLLVGALDGLAMLRLVGGRADVDAAADLLTRRLDPDGTADGARARPGG